MSRRAVVLILAGVIAAAVAIPALAAGPTAQSASVKGLSKRALAKAKDSLRQARAAKRAANRAANDAADAEAIARSAQGSASAAQGAASAAQGAAANAQKAATAASEKAGGAELNSKETRAEVASMRPKIGLAEGPVETESESFVKLAGGPSVTVSVPPTGLVQVWAQATVDGTGEADGVVSLYEDGKPVEDQAGEICGIEGVLFSGGSLLGKPELVGTPAVLNPVTGACGTLGAPGPVLFRSSAGEHTFELRYAVCSCSGSAEKMTFTDRRLYVQPLP